MIRRLTCIQASSLTLPKWHFKANLRILNTSRLQHIRISTCPNIKYSPARPIEDQHKNNGIMSAITAVKGNPYVRLMRMDKPIGEISLQSLNMTADMSSLSRLVALILALWLVSCAKRSGRMSPRSQNACNIRCRFNINARSWMHD